MEQRDLIKDQIEQLSRVMRYALEKFLGLKDEGEPSIQIEIIQQELKEKEKLDADILQVLSEGKIDDLPSYFWSKENVLLSIQLLQQLCVANGDDKYKSTAIQLIDTYFEKSETLDMELMNWKKQFS